MKRHPSSIYGGGLVCHTSVTRDGVMAGPTSRSRTEEGSLTDHEEAYVRTYEGVAIVVCRQSAEGVFENGRYDIDESFRVTLVFGWNDGEWRPAGLHLSPILGRP